MKLRTHELPTALASGTVLTAALLFSVIALAEDEIDAPASDLMDETPIEGDEEPASKPSDDHADATSATWESYGDPTGGASIAEEVTGGVRVEDIVEPPADYRYAAFGKPDPFVPPMITEDQTVDPLEIPIVSPLQRFQLTSLDLVGVWQLSSGERKAMVMTPGASEGGGQGIIVKNGDPIANRGGKILSIGDDYLTVREFSLAPDGTRQFEDRQLFMGKRTEETGKLRFTPGNKETKTIDDSSGRLIYGESTPGVGGGAAATEALPPSTSAMVVPSSNQGKAAAAPPAAPPAAAPTTLPAAVPTAGPTELP